MRTRPQVDWVPCSTAMPNAGVYVWVLLTKVHEVGIARRFEREVHMGVFNGESETFTVFPYNRPCTNQVIGWASMMPPEPPMMVSRIIEDVQNDNEGEEWKAS